MSHESTEIRGNRTCGICKENVSKYCCPRCEIFYCSLNCYKSEKHIECSESFYRDCINEELSSHYADDESKRKMIEILKKMHNDDIDDPQEVEELLENIDNIETVDSDDEEGLDLEDRIKDLNLDDADAIWNALTQDERNEFEAMLNQGEVGTIIPQWEPWWIYRKEEKLIQDMTVKENTEDEALQNCPSLKDVPKFNSLTTVQPSPAIKFNITNVLASYVFIIRYFNGEIDPVEAITYLLSVCSNLDTNTNFEELAMAVESVAQKCLQSDLIETDEVSLDVMKHDTFLILQGPSEQNKSHYCKAALSHIHQIFSEARLSLKTKISETVTERSDFTKKFPEHRKEHLSKLDVNKIKKCIKKIEYYLSFVNSFGMEFD